MEGLVKSSIFNFGRMLFGNGSGVLGEVVEDKGDKNIYMNDVSGIFEGMIIQFTDPFGDLLDYIPAKKVTSVDRKNKTFCVEGGLEDGDLTVGTLVIVQGSYEKELTGLKAIFSDSATLYGLERSKNPFLVPYIKEGVGEISENIIQTAIDDIENDAGSSINFIVCSFGVRRALQELLSKNRRSIDTMELAGGFKAMSYNGIPIVADRFCPEGTMYLLNTEDFALHQLCDWQWMEGEDGKVLKQVPGKPVYTATLVKYADLLCSRPKGQGMLSGITEA
jgi:hypothetical protein